MKNIEIIKNIKYFFQDLSPLRKRDLLIDTILVLLLLGSLYRQFKNIEFIYESNAISIHLIIPLIIMFALIWRHNDLNKGNLLSSMSIVLAVFIFWVSFAYNDASKIKLLSDMNGYNCMVTQNILTLKEKATLSDNFILKNFVFQPYLDNASFILQRLGTTTGANLLDSASSAQSANVLISQIQNLNIQGSNPLFSQFIVGPLKMYNGQLIEIASRIGKVFCSQLF